MAKFAKSCTLNGELTYEDGAYLVEEFTKDDSKVFSLNDILDSFVGANISIAIKQSDDMEPSDMGAANINGIGLGAKGSQHFETGDVYGVDA